MKFEEKLNELRKKNNSLLCVGLDTDKEKIKTDMVEFNKKIIDETIDLVCCYKINSAFYEAYGNEGIDALIKTRKYAQDVPMILDAKRGDIANTNRLYARMAFDLFNFDAITVNPYLGIEPLNTFFEYKDKFVFILCLTSNPGAKEFQLPNLYIDVAKKIREIENAGLVVGATMPEYIKEIRSVVGDKILLIPGIGVQGGDIKSVVEYGGENIIINCSRSIIYSDNPRKEAIKLRNEINRYRKNI